MARSSSCAGRSAGSALAAAVGRGSGAGCLLQAASEGMVSCCPVPSSSRITGFVNRVAKVCFQHHFLILLNATCLKLYCTALLNPKRAKKRNSL